MWCSTAWPSTRSKLPSSNGRRSASAVHGLDLQPRRFALAPSVASIPGEMSVQVACSITPARSRFSVKYPVPAPISRERA